MVMASRRRVSGSGASRRARAAGGSPQGLVHLAHRPGSDAANVAITATALADVVMDGLFESNGSVGLAELVRAAGLSAETQVDGGSFVLTRAEATAGIGPGMPGPVLVVDYEAAVHFGGINVGAFAIDMDETPFVFSYPDV